MSWNRRQGPPGPPGRPGPTGQAAAVPAAPTQGAAVRTGRPRPGGPPAGAIPRPAPAAPAAVKGRPRRVRRRVKRIDVWPVLVISFLFYLGLLAVVLVAGVLVWEVADAAGAITHFQHFAVKIGFSRITHLGSRIFYFILYVGLALVGVGTVVNVILATVYNLVADLVGGIGLVVEERDPPPRGLV